MTFSEGDVCPCCEKGKLKHEIKDLPFTYNGNTTILTTDMYTCDLCNESVLNVDSAKKLEDSLSQERNRLNKG